MIQPENSWIGGIGRLFSDNITTETSKKGIKCYTSLFTRCLYSPWLVTVKDQATDKRYYVNRTSAKKFFNLADAKNLDEQIKTKIQDKLPPPAVNEPSSPENENKQAVPKKTTSEAIDIQKQKNSQLKPHPQPSVEGNFSNLTIPPPLKQEPLIKGQQISQKKTFDIEEEDFSLLENANYEFYLQEDEENELISSTKSLSGESLNGNYEPYLQESEGEEGFKSPIKSLFGESFVVSKQKKEIKELEESKRFSFPKANEFLLFSPDEKQQFLESYLCHELGSLITISKPAKEFILQYLEKAAQKDGKISRFSRTSLLKIDRLTTELGTRNQVIVATTDKGDCFYDAVVQGIQSTDIPDVKTLREKICDYTKKNKEKASEILLREKQTPLSYEEYLEKIPLEFTSEQTDLIWGRPSIEGLMIANMENVKIDVLEILDPISDISRTLITLQNMSTEAAVKNMIGHLLDPKGMPKDRDQKTSQVRILVFLLALQKALPQKEYLQAEQKFLEFLSSPNSWDKVFDIFAKDKDKILQTLNHIITRDTVESFQENISEIFASNAKNPSETLLNAILHPQEAYIPSDQEFPPEGKTTAVQKTVSIAIYGNHFVGVKNKS